MTPCRSLWMFAALGAIFSFPVTASALHKLGSRGASLLSGVLLAVGLVAFGLAPTWAHLQ